MDADLTPQSSGDQQADLDDSLPPDTRLEELERAAEILSVAFMTVPNSPDHDPNVNGISITGDGYVRIMLESGDRSTELSVEKKASALVDVPVKAEVGGPIDAL